MSEIILSEYVSSAKFRIVCLLKQSDLSLFCRHEETSAIVNVPSEDSDQPAHMCRLI